jgi:GNAT superfamily N-acetyltransferase
MGSETVSIDLRIVEANPIYSDIVAQLVHDLLSELYADQCHLFLLEKMKAAAGKLLQSGSTVWSFLALVNNEVVGVINLNECSAIYAGGKFGEITEMYVKPDYRSKDIGEKLIEKAKNFARERSWEVIEVGAPDVPRCKKTVNFYLKNGFAEIGPRLELHV